jgi:hypothetical protein
MKLLIQLQIDLGCSDKINKACKNKTQEEINKAFTEATNEYIRNMIEDQFEKDELLDVKVVSVNTHVIEGSSPDFKGICE